MQVSDIKVSASILAADPLNLGSDVANVIKAGSDRLHVDIMDGHYVPNVSFGPGTILALKKAVSIPFDVHIMVKPVDTFIEMYAEAANTLIIHPECTDHLHRSLTRIKELGIHTGIALNPGSSIELLKPVLGLVDHVLVMSVNPGFGGQSFIESSISKIRDVHALIQSSNHSIELSVDGGINASTAPKVTKAGATILVAGNAIFKERDYAKAVHALKNPLK